MELTKRDGISYPNRILRQVVTRLPVQQYKFEYHSDWTDGRFYDCYFVFQNKEYVIEMDGKQHYKDSKWTTYEYQKEIDEYKNNLAESNNIQMIRIDCSISQFYYIGYNIPIFCILILALRAFWNIQSGCFTSIESITSCLKNICNF